MLDDTPGMTAMEMRSKARRWKAENGLDLIIVDYLQLMQGSSKRASDNRQQEMSEISRSLKGLARELNVPVIALSQLSRSVESRTSKRPMLSDLRESGALEQDADIVCFIYRDDYYNPDTEQKNVAELIVAKHRNGPVGTVNLFFQKDTTHFFRPYAGASGPDGRPARMIQGTAQAVLFLRTHNVNDFRKKIYFCSEEINGGLMSPERKSSLHLS